MLDTLLTHARKTGYDELGHTVPFEPARRRRPKSPPRTPRRPLHASGSAAKAAANTAVPPSARASEAPPDCVAPHLQAPHMRHAAGLRHRLRRRLAQQFSVMR